MIHVYLAEFDCSAI